MCICDCMRTCMSNHACMHTLACECIHMCMHVCLCVCCVISAGYISICAAAGHNSLPSTLTIQNKCHQMSNNNNNNNRIQRRYSRFFTISSQRCELSPTRTLKWPGRNCVQIACNTSSAYHVQTCYVPLGTKGQLSY